MDESRTVDFNSCCRLCLTTTEPMKFVFEDAGNCRKLVQDIVAWVSVHINVDDKLTTNVCLKCVGRLKEWCKLKKTIGINQLKLIQQMNISQNNLLADMSIQIKDELDYAEDTVIEMPLEVTLRDDDDDDEIFNVEQIKVERIDPMNDELQPPLLSPYNLDPIRDATVDLDVSNLLVPFREVAVQMDSNSGHGPDKLRYCRICNKLFSSVNNRLRHEKNIHHINDANKSRNVCIINKEIISKREKHLEQLNASPVPPEENEPSVEVQENGPTNIEIEKTQFAAELQLLRRDAVCNLSKVELFYVEKFKGLLISFRTLKCVCHNLTFMKRKEVVKHLRYFFGIPVYTCFNCMISYPSRSTYYKRSTGRCKRDLSSMVKLSQIRQNSNAKIRAYHNLICRECNYTFFFEEDIKEHIDREHVNTDGPYQCSVCSSVLSTYEDYKLHLYGDCLVSHSCDVCYNSFPNVQAFEEHSKSDHDNVDITPKQKLYIGLMKDMDGSFVDAEAAPPDLQSADLDEDSEEGKVFNPVKLKSRKRMRLYGKTSKFNPVKCDVCGKKYSNIYNLRRHVSVHNGLKMIECEHCFEKFRLKSELNDHMTEMHNLPRNRAARRSEVDVTLIQRNSTRTRIIKKPAQYDNTAIYSCADCGKLFENLSDWKDHRAEHNEYVCNECGLQFDHKGELDQHRSAHLNLKLYRDPKSSSYKTSLMGTTTPPGIVLMCEICDTMFTSKTALQQHKALHQQMPTLTVQERADTKQQKADGPRTYKCPFCMLVFDTYKRMWNHKKSVHFKPPPKMVLVEPNSKSNVKPNEPNVAKTATKTVKPIPVTYPRKCELCNKMLASYSSFWKHKRRHLRKQLDIPVEIEVIETNDKDLYPCKYCNKVFGSKKSRHIHIKSHKPARKYDRSGKFVKNFQCNICDKTCVGMAELRKHKNSEHFVTGNANRKPNDENDEKYGCDSCNGKFTTPSALKKHKEEKHVQNNDGKVYCKICGAGFKQIHLLDLHVQKEHPTYATKDKKYVCDLCDKICDTPTSLIVHKGWHKRSSSIQITARDENETTLAFKCGSCPESFDNETHLQIHILKTHRSIEATIQISPTVTSLSCDKCRYSFKSNVEYDSHMRMHESMGNKKAAKCLSCEQCGKRFSRSDSLKAHMKTSHKVEHLIVEPLIPGFSTEKVAREFPCKHCSKVFDRSQSLGLHNKIHERQMAAAAAAAAAATADLSKDGAVPIVVTNPNLGKTKGQANWYYSCTACNVQFDSTKKLRVHMIKEHK